MLTLCCTFSSWQFSLQSWIQHKRQGSSLSLSLCMSPLSPSPCAKGPLLSTVLETFLWNLKQCDRKELEVLTVRWARAAYVWECCREKLQNNNRKHWAPQQDLNKITIVVSEIQSKKLTEKWNVSTQNQSILHQDLLPQTLSQEGSWSIPSTTIFFPCLLLPSRM